MMRAGELRKSKVPVYKPEISTGHHNTQRVRALQVYMVDLIATEYEAKCSALIVVVMRLCARGKVKITPFGYACWIYRPATWRHQGRNNKMLDNRMITGSNPVAGTIIHQKQPSAITHKQAVALS